MPVVGPDISGPTTVGTSLRPDTPAAVLANASPGAVALLPGERLAIGAVSPFFTRLVAEPVLLVCEHSLLAATRERAVAALVVPADRCSTGTLVELPQIIDAARTPEPEHRNVLPLLADEILQGLVVPAPAELDSHILRATDPVVLELIA